MTHNRSVSRFLSPSLALLDAGSAKNLDEQTILELGISGDTLMEMAGAKSADVIRKLYPNLCKAVCVCGKGNNGGDGLVLARHLLNHGIDVSVIVTHAEQDLSELAALNLDRLRKTMDGFHRQHNESGAEVKPGSGSEIFFAPDDFDWNSAFNNGWNQKTSQSEADLGYAGLPIEEPGIIEPDTGVETIIIDALFGTGLSTAMRGTASYAAEAINNSRLPVISMDIPSGLNATDGSTPGVAVCADHTFCMGYFKLGCFIGEGPLHSGRPHRIDLGFPSYLIEGGKRWLINRELAEQLPHKVTPRTHKYASGVVHVVGGSSGLAGAAVLAASSAWKSGCGAVFVHVPGSEVSTVTAANPHLIVHGYGDGSHTHFTAENAPKLLENLKKRNGTVLLGPGLGNHAQTEAFVRSVMQNLEGNLVVDADGIRLMDHEISFAGDLILTPHPGELEHLSRKIFQNAYQRLELVQTIAAERARTIVSKGNPSFVVNKHGLSWIAGYDCRRFARAGFGDVLAGKIAGYLAQGDLAEISCIHALWHGKLRYDAVAFNQLSTPDPLDCI
jgi:ADP-dependent NAD(P)H-hydrate dehydratase / NAD(P)H-hydrate epimerase